MFQVGDCVVSASGGICKIVDIVKMDISGTRNEKDCFLLVPIQDENMKLYIPVDVAPQRIRKVMERKEAEELIEEMSSVDELVVENERFREKDYKDAVYSGQPQRIVSVIKNIYARRQERLAQGKKTTVVDDRYFKTAVHILHSELAYAMECKEDEVENIIIKRILGD